MFDFSGTWNSLHISISKTNAIISVMESCKLQDEMLFFVILRFLILKYDTKKCAFSMLHKIFKKHIIINFAQSWQIYFSKMIPEFN